MKDTIMAISIGDRKEAVPEVQELLTEYGCIIRTRLGLHTAGDDCRKSGLILLEISSENKNDVKELEKKLDKIETVSSNSMEI